jgi:hypothetical protein
VLDLVKLGVPNVRALLGGYGSWVADGNRIVKGEKAN